VVLDYDRLKASLYHPQHLLTFSHLDAEFAILANLLLDLHLLLRITLLVGLLTASQDLHDLHVFGKYWHLDEVRGGSSPSLGLVVTDQVDLLRTRLLTGVTFFFMGFPYSPSTASFMVFALLPVSDQHFGLEFVPFCLLYIVFSSRFPEGTVVVRLL
jgi:hypothetical protein